MIPTGRNLAKESRRRKQKQRLCVAFCVAAWFVILSQRLARVPEVRGDAYTDITASTFQGTQENIGKSSRICSVFPTSVTKRQFYPQRFFEQGSGGPYLPTLRHVRDDFPDILNARFLVMNLTERCQAIYYHIHKNGGTTLERHVPLAIDNYYSKREKSMGHDEFERASKKIMQRVYSLQQSPNPVPVFTFLRDPVSRFLSSVSQVLKLRVWHKRLHPCYEHNTTTELLECVLHKIENEGSFLEMHLNPQSFELYKYAMGYDIQVDVMDLSDMDTVLLHAGAKAVPKERSTTGSLIRRFPKFRLSKEALTPELIESICRVYQVDVIMLKETGVTETICPPTVSSYLGDKF